jgi:hypothetical protein
MNTDVLMYQLALDAANVVLEKIKASYGRFQYKVEDFSGEKWGYLDDVVDMEEPLHEALKCPVLGFSAYPAQVYYLKNHIGQVVSEWDNQYVIIGWGIGCDTDYVEFIGIKCRPSKRDLATEYKPQFIDKVKKDLQIVSALQEIIKKCEQKIPFSISSARYTKTKLAQSLAGEFNLLSNKNTLNVFESGFLNTLINLNQTK